MFSKPKTISDSNKNDEKSNSNPQEIDIKGLDKAALLQGLHNRSKPLGFGYFNPLALQQMTYEEAEELIGRGELSFNYLNGRPMKISLEGDTLDFWGYDRDNGKGAALEVVTSIKTGQVLQAKQVKPTNAL